MKVNISALFVAFALCLTPQIGFGAKGELKKVTRVESVIAEKKGRKIVVHVDGMAPTTASLFGNNGQLVRHGSELKANKDGLLEYDLCFNPPGKDVKEKLKAVRATLTESNIPDEVKGVRIFAEYNEMNGLFSEAKQKKKERKQLQKQGPAPKKKGE